MDKYCKYCEVKLVRRVIEYNDQWANRRFCSIKCAKVAEISIEAKLRAVKVIELYKTGKYTLREVGAMSGGISAERARQIIFKNRDKVKNYYELVKNNRLKGYKKNKDHYKSHKLLVDNPPQILRILPTQG